MAVFMDVLVSPVLVKFVVMVGEVLLVYVLVAVVVLLGGGGGRRVDHDKHAAFGAPGGLGS